MPACRSPLAERAGIRKSEGHSVSVPLASDRGVSQTEAALQFQRCNLWWAGAYRAVWTLAGRRGDSRNHARSMTNVVPLPGWLRTAILRDCVNQIGRAHV